MTSTTFQAGVYAVKHLIPAAVLLAACIISAGVSYELSMYFVARQCIDQGGWQHAFHRYECRQVL